MTFQRQVITMKRRNCRVHSMTHAVRQLFLIGASVIGPCSSCYAVSPEELNRSLSQSVIEICRGGTLNGKNFKIDVEGDARGTIVFLKRLFDAGLDGSIILSQEEWEGIKPLVFENDSRAGYNACVKDILDRLTPKVEAANQNRLGELKIYNNQNVKICGSMHTIMVDVYKKSGTQAENKATIHIEGFEKIHLEVGNSLITTDNCKVTLSGTGFDWGPFALISYEKQEK